MRWLRLEAVSVFAMSVVLYARGAHGWVLFFALLLVPDLSMAGYLAGPRLGATMYNFAHTYVVALALAAYGVLAGQALAVSLALIWTAHIGMDRTLGYGLKLPTGFQHTHLGNIGRKAGSLRA